jgi:hypothetical protein
MLLLVLILFAIIYIDEGWIRRTEERDRLLIEALKKYLGIEPDKTKEED